MIVKPRKPIDVHKGQAKILPLWLSPAILLGLFILAFATFLWFLRESTYEIETKELVADAESVGENMRLRLNGNRDYLLMLAQARADGLLDAKLFQERASRYVADHPELICINWVDASYLITDVAPIASNRQIVGLRLDLPEPKRASHLAMEGRQPVYTRPFDVIQGGLAFELWVPVFHRDVFLGLFGAIYSYENLLHSVVNPQVLKANTVSVVDASGKLLLELPLTGTLDGKLAYLVSPIPSESELSLRVNRYGRGASEWGLLSLEVLCLALVLAMSYAMWMLKCEADARKRSEEALRTVVQTIPDLVWLKDPEGVYLNCNPEFERFFGATESEIIGKTDYDFVDRELADFFREHDRKAMAAGGPSINEESITYASDGHRALLETIKTPMRDTTGKVIGVLGTARDITQRRQLEEALRESEAKYRSLFGAIPSPFYYKDCDGRYLGCNIAFENYLGKCKDEIVGRTVHDIVPKELADSDSAADRALVDHPGTQVYEGKLRWADGSLRDVIFHKATFTRADGSLAGVAGLMLDITERKAAEDQLRKLSLAVEQTPESIVITDIDGRIEYVNAAFVRNTGYSCEEVLGQSPRILQSGKTPRGTYDSLWDALTHERPWKGEFHNRRKDGSEYVEFASITPLRQPDGNVTHYLAVKEDITEKRRMGMELDNHRHHLEDLVLSRTAQLAEATQRADAANRAKSAFLANMSHEIRTPMNAIVGMSNILRRGGVTLLQAERLDTIDAAAQHLLSVINDILDLSKIESGKLVLEEVPVAINSLMANINSILSGRAKERGIRLLIETEPLPYNLVGDPTRLQQALLNYGTNAVKFTETGSVTLRTRVQAEADNQVALRFEVQDTGIGIAPEAMSRLFTDFEQVDNSMTRKYGGTGLGLAITRRLVELLGGEVGADSTPGVGSTFWFTVKLKKSEEVAATQTTSALDAEAMLQQHYSGRRILVVDDEPVNREIAQMQLEDAKLVVDAAEDGAEAVAMAQRTSYAAIFMDMQMPTLNGLEATLQIRALPGYRTTPIIAMTANAFAEDKAQCFNAGMSDFLTKPFNPDMLYATLLRSLSKSSG